MAEDAFDPLTYDNLAQSVIGALMKRGTVQLAPSEPFGGPGVYAIYYTGSFAPYASIATPACEHPIYVGKAVLPGARKGKGVSDMQQPVLFRRLQDHAKSIECAKNLVLADFRCRDLVVQEVWVTLAEQFLIKHYSPIWNKVIDGFGNHPPGAGRREMRRPRWDILHPGREWAAGLKARESAEAVLGALKTFLEGRT